jgi:hypothetical protein
MARPGGGRRGLGQVLGPTRLQAAAHSLLGGVQAIIQTISHYPQDGHHPWPQATSFYGIQGK